MADPRSIDWRNCSDDRSMDRRLRRWRRTMSAQDTNGSVKKTSMRTPLGRVRNLGSAHGGTSDFFRQRVTAVAMVLLIVPVIVVIMSMLGRNQAGAAAILGSPLVAVIL